MTGAHDRRVDVAALKDRLLSDVDALVAELLPGAVKRGKYWKFGGIGQGEGNSAWVDPLTGAWRDEADSRPAGDLISLVAECRFGGDNAEALRYLAERYGMLPAAGSTGAAPRPLPPAPPAPPPAADAKRTAQWVPVHPVPDDAPHYTRQWAHYARGVPNRHWEYRDQAGQLLGVVCRFDKPNGEKDVQPLSYAQQVETGKREWRYLGFAKPRPLYGLERLPALNPDDPQLVLLVEGEKCADALHGVFGPVPVLSWPGGGKAVAEVDMGPLAGFRVLAWPDADAKRQKLSADERAAGVDPLTKPLLPLLDQPGMRAMLAARQALLAVGATVQMIDPGQPGERPDGWDCADAIADGWTKGQLREFMARRLPADVLAQADGAAAGASGATCAGGATGPAPASAGGRGAQGSKPHAPAARAEGEGGAGDDADEWRTRLILARGNVRECTPNVMLVLANHAAWKGVLAYDEFAQKVVKRGVPPFVVAGGLQSDEWADTDDTRTAAWIAMHEQWVPSAAMVAEAVEVVARSNPFHPVREYLQSLKWDEVNRVDHWLPDCLEVEDTEYSRRVSRYFLIGMCRRVIEPGCKFDTCLVLEGKQGRNKSTALSTLAGRWFSDTELDLSNKDAMSSIRGKWLHEFGEMGSIARAESTRQKSFLSRQVDEFRPSYGRREIRCPRQGAFAGTTNEWAWNKDPTGGRRFWPVEVRGAVDVKKLAAIRDQLFAEAYQLALGGERYWPTADEQRELFDPEQLAREAPEAYVELLAPWLADERNWELSPDGPVDEFTLADAITRGLKIDAKGITRDIQTRVGMALAKLDCEKVEYRTRAVRHWYRRPAKKAASSMANAGVEGMEGMEDLPL